MYTLHWHSQYCKFLSFPAAVFPSCYLHAVRVCRGFPWSARCIQFYMVHGKKLASLGFFSHQTFREYLWQTSGRHIFHLSSVIKKKNGGVRVSLSFSRFEKSLGERALVRTRREGDPFLGWRQSALFQSSDDWLQSRCHWQRHTEGRWYAPQKEKGLPSFSLSLQLALFMEFPI